MGYEWFKLYTQGVLRGSIVAQLTYDEQLCWIKLLAFASECRDRGIIRRAKGIPFEREDVARYIGMPELVLHTTIEKCIKDENADDCRTRIMILPDGSLQIANWGKYQGKPDRIKAKEAGIEKSKRDKRSTTNAIIALTRTINEQNRILGRVRYTMDAKGNIVDKQTGQSVKVEDLEGIEAREE